MIILSAFLMIVYVVVGYKLMSVAANTFNSSKENLFLILALTWFVMVPAILMQIGILE